MKAVSLLCATFLVAFQYANADPVGQCPSEMRPEGVDFLVDSNDCSVFYKCDSGKPVKYLCPTILHFNRVTNECDWPERAACNCGDTTTTTTECGCDTTTTCKPTTTTTTTTTCKPTTTTTTTTTCKPTTTTTTTTTCKPTTTTTTTTTCKPTTTTTTTTTPKPCDTTTTPKPCDTTTTPKPCDTTTTPKPCDTTTTPRPCDTTTTSKPPCNDCPDEKCPQEDCYYSVYYAHPKSCGRYCQCDNGKAQDMACPSGLHFNAVKNVCDWPADANCRL